MTHYADCWKGHLTCALIRAVDLLAEYAEDPHCVEDGCVDDTAPEVTEFIKHIREEM